MGDDKQFVFGMRSGARLTIGGIGPEQVAALHAAWKAPTIGAGKWYCFDSGVTLRLEDVEFFAPMTTVLPPVSVLSIGGGGGDGDKGPGSAKG